MPDKPLVVVTGATGQQGGSVVNFLLESGLYRVRGVTRNVDSPKSKDLATRGVEIVKANLDNLAEITDAFKGAYGVFGVTNFWDPNALSEEAELRQGKNLVDAAKATGVKHFVWSTLDHTQDPHVAHWESKAKVDDYLKASGVPRTSLYTCFYFENFFGSTAFSVKKGDDGGLVADWSLLWSDGPIWGYSVAETGAFVLEALKKPDEWVDKDLRVMTEIFTPRQFIDTLSEVSGKQIALKNVKKDAFEALQHVPGVQEIWANMEWFYTRDGNKDRDPALTKKLYPSRKSFAEFVKANTDKLLPA